MSIVLGFLASLSLSYWLARHEEWEVLPPRPKRIVIDARTIAAMDLLEECGYSGEYVETIEEITQRRP